MANAPNEAPSFIKKVRDFIHAYGELETVWGLAVAFVAAAKAVSMMPSGWYPPQYWASAGAWFFGTWAVAGSTVFAIKKSIPRFKRWVSPHALNVTPTGGAGAVLTVKHVGEPARWSCDARIVRHLDGTNNSRPSLFACFLRPRGRNSYRVLDMEEENWANIVLATIDYRGFTPHELSIHSADGDSTVPLSGCILEVCLKSKPKQKTEVLDKYQIRCVRSQIEITKVP